MDAIEGLHKRVSITKITSPAPTDGQLQVLLRAATRAADHGNMRPWRFLVIEGQGLVALGELFANRAVQKNPAISEPELARFKSMPLRAPMIIIVIAKCQENPKVPMIEQLLSAGAATQNIINAAFALGLGAIWRTGDMAYDPEIKHALGLIDNEEIIGFVYIGTPTSVPHEPRKQDVTDFFTYWPQQ